MAILPPTRQQKEREQKKANKRRRKKAALEGVGQHGDPGEVVQQLEGSQQKSEGAVPCVENEVEAAVARGEQAVVEAEKETVAIPVTAENEVEAAVHSSWRLTGE